MNIFLLCSNEIPEVCALEVKELIGKKAEVFPGVCIVSNVTQDDMAILVYRCQSAYHIGVLLAQDSNIEKLEENFAKEIDIAAWDSFSSQASTFAVQTVKLSEHDIPSPDISASFGAVIKDYAESKEKELDVKLTNPDVSYLVFIAKDICGVGVDLIGFDLSKRPYKLFHHPGSLNGVFAYTISRFVGIKENSVVLDPFCNNGVIPIEIALFQEGMSSFLFERKFTGLRYNFTKEFFEEVESSLKEVKPENKNIFAYDEQLKIMLGAKKNAKIAGVLESVDCSKVSVDWLDTKFEKGDIDFIISNPPKDSKRLNNTAKIAKMYDELFYQSRFVLGKNGRVGILSIKSDLIKENASKHQFEVVNEIKVSSGKQEYFLTICKRKA